MALRGQKLPLIYLKLIDLWMLKEVIFRFSNFFFFQINKIIFYNLEYEQTFDKLQFNGEIELSSLMDFFKECHLYPSLPEVREALDFIYRGIANVI